MRRSASLFLVTVLLALAACDASSAGGESADIWQPSQDLVSLPDSSASCAEPCDEMLCLACQDGDCVSVCKADERCVDGSCQLVESPCVPACGDCEICESGSCASACTGDEQCHEGSCQVPPSGCAPACGDCETCDTSDPWGPVCLSECTGEELCHEGSCQVPPACAPVCVAADCESCETSDLWNPSCVTICDTANCQGCDGAGNCVGQCVAARCEACDGEGNCAVTCDTAACQGCDGAGACVSQCDPDDCEICDGAGSCSVTCGDEEYCDAGQCLARPDLTCAELDGYCPGSVASLLEVAEAPEAAGVNACCCDLTGDGKPDNKLGELIELLEPFVGYDRDYFNAQIAGMIEAGHLLFLFEILGLEDTNNDPYTKFHVYQGLDADGWAGNNLTGAGEFYVTRDSLDRDGNPIMVFEDAEVFGGTLYGGPSRFLVPMDIIGAGEPIMFMMEGARITADISARGVGYDLANGTVCGYVERAKIVSEVNEYTGMNCGCLNLAGDFLTDQGTSISCGQAAAASTCDQFDSVEYLCQQLFDNCGMLALIMPALFDVDSDLDGRRDAMSVGFTFEAVPADLIGLEPR